MPRGGKRAGAGRPRKPEAVPKGPLRTPQKGPPVLSVIQGGATDAILEPDWSLVYSDSLDINRAQRAWRDYVGDLRDNEKLAKANALTIERLVHQVVQGQIALRHVAEDGAVFPRKGKKQPAYNPWWSIYKDACSMATALEAELTITPRRRANGGKVKPKKKHVAASDEFLGPVAG